MQLMYIALEAKSKTKKSKQTNKKLFYEVIQYFDPMYSSFIIAD